jgi:hypothetical protein
MPDSVHETIASFIAEHYVEPTFERRWHGVARNTGVASSDE